MPGTSRPSERCLLKLPYATRVASGGRTCARPGFFKRVLTRWLGNLWPAPPAEPDEETPLPSPEKQLPPGGGTGYTPKPGQRGKNVQWVPCSPVVLDKMLDLAGVAPDDYVIDPGSGDGRIAIRAAMRGARALGMEFNPRLVTIAQQNAVNAGVDSRTVFCVGDFFELDFIGATVVTLFLRKDINIKLRPKLLTLAPGTRIVSNIFDMGEWRADTTVDVEDGGYYFRNHVIHLWTVPARAGGLWRLPNGTLALKQKYQMITGTLETDGTAEPVDGELSGKNIRFTAGGRRYTGIICDHRMLLEANDSSNIRWVATLEDEGGTTP